MLNESDVKILIDVVPVDPESQEYRDRVVEILNKG